MYVDGATAADETAPDGLFAGPVRIRADVSPLDRSQSPERPRPNHRCSLSRGGGRCRACRRAASLARPERRDPDGRSDRQDTHEQPPSHPLTHLRGLPVRWRRKPLGDLSSAPRKQPIESCWVYASGATAADREGAGRLIRGGGSRLASDRTDRGTVGSPGRRIIAMGGCGLPEGSRVQTRSLSNPFAYAYTCAAVRRANPVPTLASTRAGVTKTRAVGSDQARGGRRPGS